MALCTDQNVSDISDLIAYEANLPEIAGAEGIDLATKVKLAQTEVGAELEAATQRPGNVYFTEGSGWQSSGGETNLSRIDLDNIVVTPPLKLWHTFQTLAIAYRDAYNRKLNDKYLPKWKEYKELARWAADLLFSNRHRDYYDPDSPDPAADAGLGQLDSRRDGGIRPRDMGWHQQCGRRGKRRAGD